MARLDHADELWTSVPPDNKGHCLADLATEVFDAVYRLAQNVKTAEPFQCHLQRHRPQIVKPRCRILGSKANSGQANKIAMGLSRMHAGNLSDL
jgi:hypothetical protein